MAGTLGFPFSAGGGAARGGRFGHFCLPRSPDRRPGGFQEQRGDPVLACRTKRACDTESSRRPWELSERSPGRRSPLAAASHTGGASIA
jgi:hypothetical protein